VPEQDRATWVAKCPKCNDPWDDAFIRKAFKKTPLNSRETGYNDWYANRSAAVSTEIVAAPAPVDNCVSARPSLEDSSSDVVHEVQEQVVVTPPSRKHPRDAGIEPKVDPEALAVEFGKEFATLTLLDKKHQLRRELQDIQHKKTVVQSAESKQMLQAQLYDLSNEIKKIEEKGNSKTIEVNMLSEQITTASTQSHDANARVAEAKHLVLTVQEQLDALEKQKEALLSQHEGAKQRLYEAEINLREKIEHYKQLDRVYHEGEAAIKELLIQLNEKDKARKEIEEKLAKESTHEADVNVHEADVNVDELAQREFEINSNLEGLVRGESWMWNGFLRDKTGRIVFKLPKSGEV
jgi:hypothetical protein